MDKGLKAIQRVLKTLDGFTHDEKMNVLNYVSQQVHSERYNVVKDAEALRYKQGQDIGPSAMMSVAIPGGIGSL